MKITIHEYVGYDIRRSEWVAKASSLNSDHWSIALVARPTEKEARDLMPELRAKVLMHVQNRFPNENIEVAK